MTQNTTLILASSYTFKTILNISESEYIVAQSKVISQVMKENGLTVIPAEMKDLFSQIPKPNNLALFHMILNTIIVGIYENYNIDSNMPNLKCYLKDYMILKCNNSYENIDLKYILRRLRNSVSHYNYQYDGLHFIFEDNNKEKNDYFQAKFKHEEIAVLIDQIAYYCTMNFALKS